MKKITKYGRQACKKYAHNNQEWVRISRQHSDYCTFCPPNGGENIRGSHSQWGKKKAHKRLYATGKGRKQWYTDLWSLKRQANSNRYIPQWGDKSV